MKMISLVASLFLLVVGASPLRAEGYAIVVGVNDCPQFQLPDGSRPRRLRGAETDADAVAQILIDQFGFAKGNVHVLKGQQATHCKLKALFERMKRKLRHDDLFVFHFSGHGTQIAEQKRPFDEPDKLDEALCLYGAKSNGDNLLLDDELGVWLEDVPSRNVTVLLDCCHAGTGIKDPNDDIVPRYLPIKVRRPKLRKPKQPWRELRGNSKLLGRRLCAFYACRAGQFSYFFLQGLKDNQADADGNGFVSQREALQFTTERLKETFNFTKKLVSERQQPVLESGAGNQPLFWMVNVRPKPSDKQ